MGFGSISGAAHNARVLRVFPLYSGRPLRLVHRLHFSLYGPPSVEEVCAEPKGQKGSHGETIGTGNGHKEQAGVALRWSLATSGTKFAHFFFT